MVPSRAAKPKTRPGYEHRSRPRPAATPSRSRPWPAYLYTIISHSSLSRSLSFHLGNKLCSSTLLYDLFLHTLSSSDLLSSTSICSCDSCEIERDLSVNSILEFHVSNWEKTQESIAKTGKRKMLIRTVMPQTPASALSTDEFETASFIIIAEALPLVSLCKNVKVSSSVTICKGNIIPERAGTKKLESAEAMSSPMFHKETQEKENSARKKKASAENRQSIPSANQIEMVRLALLRRVQQDKNTGKGHAGIGTLSGECMMVPQDNIVLNSYRRVDNAESMCQMELVMDDH
ncbi:hypothetical protein RHGRI_012112 [Rhododendron griersonianum]|uniref:Uncharacterized protein n=1 Tax=Rhododendron griersonianum TaxID=479676 RepID=A0AAV6KPW9_9ERIC|nr:hypothetical protein RHGRI_012112 [Rhododendron griersonianum]